MKVSALKTLPCVLAIALCIGTQARASTASDIVLVAKNANAAKNKISEFIKMHAVELVQSQPTKHSGSAHPLSRSLPIGNVPALVRGILGISLDGILPPLSPSVDGLSGFGYLPEADLRINKSGHSFLMVGKYRAAFNGVIYAHFKAPELKLEDQQIQTLMDVLNNPYLVDETEVDDFMNTREAFNQDLKHLDDLIANHSDTSGPLLDRAIETSKKLNAWAQGIRVTFAMAGKTEIPVGKKFLACIHNGGTLGSSATDQCGQSYYDANHNRVKNGACVEVSSEGTLEQINAEVDKVAAAKGYTSDCGDKLHLFYRVDKKYIGILGADEGSEVEALFKTEKMEIHRDIRLHF